MGQDLMTILVDMLENQEQIERVKADYNAEEILVVWKSNVDDVQFYKIRVEKVL